MRFYFDSESIDYLLTNDVSQNHLFTSRQKKIQTYKKLVRKYVFN